MANEYLRRNNTSTGNRQVWTWSAWIKRASNLSVNEERLWTAGDGGGTGTSPRTDISFGNGNFTFGLNSTGSSWNAPSTTAQHKDVSSWCHIVFVLDTTKTDATEQRRIYFNGVEEYLAGATALTKNELTPYNLAGNIHAVAQYVNEIPSGGQNPFKGEMSDVFFVDGQALTPDVFGFYKQGKGYISAGSTQATDFRPGQWVPKTPRVIKTEINRRGGFGVNGFYLPMNDSNNFGADFHGDPNSIITLNEKLPQPRVGVASTAAVGLGYTDVLRADPYAANLVLAVPGISTSTGPNLITNGTFETSTTGWTAVQATISAVNGNLRIIPNASVNGGVYQVITTEVGKRYTVAMEVIAAGASLARLHVGTSTNIDSADKYTYTNATSVQNVGVGRYTVSFTPSTTSTVIWLEVGGGTQTQIDFDNVVVRQEDVPRDYSAFIKGSGTNKTLTANGNAGVGYNIPSYYGSALSFDGSGDYFSIPDTEDFEFGSGDYTVEFWVNCKRATSGTVYYEEIVTKGYPFQIYRDNTGKLFLAVDSNTSAYDFNLSFGTPGVGDWAHVCVERHSGTSRMYLNGVVGALSTASVTINNTSSNFTIGDYADSQIYPFTGYLQDLRVYKGVAKYKGGFDVPRPYTPVGIATWRQVPDTTANNFATLNPLANGNAINTVQISYANGNNTATWSATAQNNSTFGTVGINTGRWYWEGRLSTVGGSFPFIGISSQVGISTAQSTSNYGQSGTGVYKGSGTLSAGDIVGVAVSFTSAGVGSTVTFYVNGVESTSGTGNRSVFDGQTNTWIPGVSGVNGCVWDFNFGQNPTFSGNTTAGTFTDTNGKGLFKYQPPSGFLALCEDNLPTPAISDPGKYFKTVLWTGDGNTGRSVVGVGFTPDLVWYKARSSAFGNGLFDSVRGTFRLSSDGTGAENTDQGVISFNSDGFSLGNHASGNTSGTTMVAWCWRAGAGTTSTNTNGSITSVVSVNQDAGFSIVSWTGNGSAGTIGHGLGKTPAFRIIKDRGTTSNWYVWHKVLAANEFLMLNQTTAKTGSSSIWNNTLPTSSTISYTTATTSDRFIEYVWAEIENFSKFGSYVGNGNADGPFVYCGFKPAWILYKRIESVENWEIYDSSRQPTNPATMLLKANTSDIEAALLSNGIDILSNGFKIRENATRINASGGNYIFAAFAESPFQTANSK